MPRTNRRGQVIKTPLEEQANGNFLNETALERRTRTDREAVVAKRVRRGQSVETRKEQKDRIDGTTETKLEEQLRVRSEFKTGLLYSLRGRVSNTDYGVAKKRFSQIGSRIDRSLNSEDLTEYDSAVKEFSDFRKSTQEQFNSSSYLSGQYDKFQSISQTSGRLGNLNRDSYAQSVDRSALSSSNGNIFSSRKTLGGSL